jgi:glutaminase
MPILVNDKEFNDIVHFIKNNYEDIKSIKSGKVADYIKFLSIAPPEDFGISIHTVDNKTFSIGQSQKHVTIQSCIKPFLYCIACEQHSEKYVSQYIGHEPSGAPFNSHKLKKVCDETNRHIPYNPMVNAGAMMSIALIYRGEQISERFSKLENIIKKTTGNISPGFINTVFLSEKEKGDSNKSVIFEMRDKKSFDLDGRQPDDTEINNILDLYFQACSISITAEMGACMAATLANGGICPATDERVFTVGVVKSSLANMFFSGLYTSAGDFGHDVGFPAKSGVGGFLMAVIPGKMGICIYSPPLDVNGNSVRGVEFCKRLVTSLPYNYGFFKNNGIINNDENIDVDIAFARSMKAICKNDLEMVKKYVAISPINMTDYDSRTLLHIACSYGKYEIAEYLIENGALIDCKDGWNNTPIDDIKRFINTTPNDPNNPNNPDIVIENMTKLYDKTKNDS